MAFFKLSLTILPDEKHYFLLMLIKVLHISNSVYPRILSIFLLTHKSNTKPQQNHVLAYQSQCTARITQNDPTRLYKKCFRGYTAQYNSFNTPLPPLHTTTTPTPARETPRPLITLTDHTHTTNQHRFSHRYNKGITKIILVNHFYPSQFVLMIHITIASSRNPIHSVR